MIDICMKVAVTGYGNLPKTVILGSRPVEEMILRTYLYIPAVSEFGKNQSISISSFASHLQRTGIRESVLVNSDRFRTHKPTSAVPATAIRKG